MAKKYIANIFFLHRTFSFFVIVHWIIGNNWASKGLISDEGSFGNTDVNAIKSMSADFVRYVNLGDQGVVCPESHFHIWQRVFTLIGIGAFPAAWDHAKEVIQRLQASHPEGQKLPRLEEPREPLRPESLNDVDETNRGEEEGDSSQDRVEWNQSCHGQSKDEGRKQEEWWDEVESGKPAVFCSQVAKFPGQENWPAHEGNWCC